MDLRRPIERVSLLLARYPVALSRLEYQSDNATVTYYSSRSTTIGSTRLARKAGM